MQTSRSDQPFDERELLLQVARGNTFAFQQLVRVYKDVTYTAAWRMLQHREHAEDCTQDIFMKVWLRREALPEVENFGGWLHTVTRNTLVSAFRRLARERLLQLPDAMDLPAQDRTIEDLLTQKEHAGLLQRALNTLSLRQRQVYQLVKEEGLSRDEAARQLGVSLDTVKFHLTEASRKIRAYVTEHGDIALLLLLLIKKI